MNQHGIYGYQHYTIVLQQKTTRQNSEQHVELRQSRRMKDFEDLINFTHG